jgi:hypothetical protein
MRRPVSPLPPKRVATAAMALTPMPWAVFMWRKVRLRNLALRAGPDQAPSICFGVCMFTSRRLVECTAADVKRSIGD